MGGGASSQSVSKSSNESGGSQRNLLQKSNSGRDLNNTSNKGQIKESSSSKPAYGGAMHSQINKRSTIKARRRRMFDPSSDYVASEESDGGSVPGEVFQLATSVQQTVRAAVEKLMAIKEGTLKDSIINHVMNSLKKLTVEPGTVVIKEKEVGDKMYIIETGELSVSVGGNPLKTIKDGELFGELSLIFGALRSSTVTAVTECVLWTLDRRTFKYIQRKAANNSILQRSSHFVCVPEMAALSSLSMAQLMSSLTPMTYKQGDDLYRESRLSTKVILIEQGTVKVEVPKKYQGIAMYLFDRIAGIIRPTTESRRRSLSVASTDEALQQEPPPRRLVDGHGRPINMDYDDEDEAPPVVYLGEGTILGLGALRGKMGLADGWIWVDTVINSKPYVGAAAPLTFTAMTTVRASFFTIYRFERLVGSVSELKRKLAMIANDKEAKRQEKKEPVEDDHQCDVITIENLGLHTFSKFSKLRDIPLGISVLAVRNVEGPAHHPTQFLLKALNKSIILDMNQLKSIRREVQILQKLRGTNFITRFVGTFQTPNEVVIVLERITGGDLWQLIYKNSTLHLSMRVIRYYASRLTTALDFLQRNSIAYRNLKPENIMLDHRGDIKLVGFGFAREFDDDRSFTLCGTLEYLAPELVLRSGHDMMVDNWALGVCLYELCTGTTPFLALVTGEGTFDPEEMQNESLTGRSESPRGSLSRSVSFRGDFSNLHSGDDDLSSDDGNAPPPRLGQVKSLGELSNPKAALDELDNAAPVRRIESDVFSVRGGLTPGEMEKFNDLMNKGMLMSRSGSIRGIANNSSNEDSPSSELNRGAAMSRSSSSRSVLSRTGSGRAGALSRVLQNGGEIENVRDVAKLAYNNNSDGKSECSEDDIANADEIEALNSAIEMDILHAIASVNSTGLKIPNLMRDMHGGKDLYSLVVSLMEPNPAHRMSVLLENHFGVRFHPFFADFEWKSKQHGTLSHSVSSMDADGSRIYLEGFPSSGPPYFGDQNLFSGW